KSAKITVTATGATAELKNKSDADVKLTATSKDVTFKSKGWTEVTYTYNFTDNIWNTNKDDDHAKNSNKPERCMNDVFKGATLKTTP
ncbi:MAG: hypothetical protein PUH49_03820, partial [Lachnospiraceae bacterium]|nr:hypothetical protein [Lachnospiraceae bacterium]